MNRSPLTDSEIAQIRRARYRPSPTHYHYLHLVSLLNGLKAALARLPQTAGPALDLHCGTQPYRDVIPWRPLWGYDIDLHFGRADVVGGTRLPFDDAAFEVILCTQALYLVDDPVATVAEMRRVLRPGGYVIATVPRLFRRELSLEIKYDPEDLKRLFATWSEVQIVGRGSPAAGLVYYLGSLGLALSRRSAAARLLEPALAVVLNAIGMALDFALTPLRSWQPAMLILVARRPED
jgi:SAM-dependent methyltransferase